MGLIFDLKNQIFDYICNYTDKINFCYLDRENSERIKIKTLLYHNIKSSIYFEENNYFLEKITKKYLKQNIFSELVELDISNNERIDDVNYLKNLKKLICRGKNSKLSQYGIKDLKLKELYCEGNTHIYDIGHMKDTLIYLEPNYNIKNCVYKDNFCCFYKEHVLYLAIISFVFFTALLFIWFGIYFGLISREVYINTQYIKTTANLDAISTTSYKCCNLICNTCDVCNTTILPSCDTLTSNYTMGNCCNGYKCCETCYETCCHTRLGKIPVRKCDYCNPYCCSSVINSECYNNCGTCYSVNVYYHYIAKNTTIDLINNYNCGMNDVDCLKNINSSYNSNFTIYYDKNNVTTNTRTIEYTQANLALLGMLSVGIIIVVPILITFSVIYVHMFIKYRKFIKAHKLMNDLLSI